MWNYSTIYNPSTNGLSEAFNKTLCTIIARTVDTNKKDLKGILKNKLKNPEIFENNGNIYYQNLGFIFENNKLIQVTTEVPFNPDSKG